MSIPLSRNRANKQFSPKQITGWSSVKCTSPGENNRNLKSRICCYLFLAEIPPRRAAPKVIVQKHSKHSWIRNSTAIQAMVPSGFKSTMTVLAWISGLHLAISENHHVCPFPTGTACYGLQQRVNQSSSCYQNNHNCSGCTWYVKAPSAARNWIS